MVERVIRIQSMSGHQQVCTHWTVFFRSEPEYRLDQMELQVAGGRVLQSGKQTPLSLS